MSRHENTIAITAAHRERLAVVCIWQPDQLTPRERGQAERQYAAR